jgi:large subunit ribosomal protein L1
VDLEKAIEELKTKSKKRNFTQSVDLVMNFTRVDFTKPDNRIDVDVFLPAGRGKAMKIAAIVGDELIVQAKKVADRVLTKDDVTRIGADKKAVKKLAEDYNYFLCQVNLMALVGKHFGQVLGPKGKMPKPVPPTAKLEPLINRLKSTVKVRTKGKNLPTLHAAIGTEEMSSADLAKNASAVINAVKEKLPNREGNIRSVYIKTSMSPAQKVDFK